MNFEELQSTLVSAALLIHLGAMLYIIGFMVRDELVLRLLVLGGTVLYICYYVLFPETPLWDAIITSAILGAVNLWVLMRIVFERTTFAMTPDEKKLYEVFSTLNPGQFRLISKIANWHDADSLETMCVHEKEADRLFYLFEGGAQVSKGDAVFDIPPGNFLGEIAFILGGAYTADVKAKEGTRYVSWNNEILKKKMSRNAELNNALVALFNHDLAKKLAVSKQ